MVPLMQLVYILAAGTLMALIGAPILLGVVQLRGVRDPATQFIVAAAAGLLGAAILFMLRTDFVPDQVEVTGDPALIVVASLVVVAAVVLGYRRR
jgi:hypothetical protein